MAFKLNPITGKFEITRKSIMGNDIRVADTVVTNTTNETTIHTSAEPANTLRAGRMYKVVLLGKITTASGSDFVTLRFKMGGVTLITKTMAATNLTDAHFQSECYITIRTTGASGTYAAHAEGVLGGEIISETPVTGSVDTTVAGDLTTTVQWDAAKTGNIFTVMQSSLEIIG